MSVDLETQLRSYRRNFDSEAPAVDLLGRTDQPVGAPDTKRPALIAWRIRRGLAVAIAAAVLVLIAIGGVGLISQPVANEPDPDGVVENGWIAVGEGGDIWLLSLDQERRQVTDTDMVDELCPAFAPDGRRLAYGRWEGESVALAVVDVDADGRVSDPVTIEVGDGLPTPCPLWSPDGSQIAFAEALTDPVNPTTSAAGSEVWIVALSDRRVTVLPDLLATDLEWSPDGSQLAIVSGADDMDPGNQLRDSRIYLYELASGTLRAIESSLGAGFLTWSPDGGRIAYHAGRQLRVIDIETEQQEVLDMYGDDYGIGPVWSPDGEWILHSETGPSGGFSDRRLVPTAVGASADGAETVEEVVLRPFIETAEGPCPLVARWATWSPDGRYLLHVGENLRGCGSNLTFLATVPIDLELIRSALMEADGYVEVDLAAAKLPEPEPGGSDGRYDFRSLPVPIQTWGIRPSD